MSTTHYIPPRRVISVASAAIVVGFLLVLGLGDAAAQARTPGAAEPTSPPSIRRLRDRDGRTLVRTESARGIGLAGVPASIFDGLSVPTAVGEQDVEALRGLASLGRHAEVIRLAGPMLSRHPEHPAVRRLMAASLRHHWQFAASSLLYEDLCREAEETARIDKSASPDLTLLMEAAEVAVLLGEKRVWDPAIRRYRRYAKAARDKYHENRSDVIERHAEGKGIGLLAEGTPPHRDEVAQAKERAAVDRRKATHHVGIAIGQSMVDLLDSRPNMNSKAEIVLTPLDKDAEERYMAGGPESAFRGRIKLARAAVTVNRTAWLSLWDHEKHEELFGLGYILRERFPGADVNVALYTPATVNGRDQPFLAASIRIPYNKSPIIELMSLANWDPKRDEAIREEQEDAEDQWKGRVR